MSNFILSPSDINISAIEDSLSTYEFDSGIAKHHFCNRCGIYPFHQTMRKPGQYRVNVGCIEGIDALALPIELVDGASF